MSEHSKSEVRTQKRRAGQILKTLHSQEDAEARARAAGYSDSADGLRGFLLAGLAAMIVLVGGVGGWAATTDITGAVLTAGTVVVESNVKKVQHPTGGIVGEIKVKNGDSVNAGDLLMRLDETLTRASLQVVTRQLSELSVRQARLAAERDGAETLSATPQSIGLEDSESVQRMLKSETTLFDSRRAARIGQKSQLAERKSQLSEEIAGRAAQLESNNQQIELVKKELEGLESLYEKRLVPTTKINSLRREAARIDGERGQLVAAIAQAKGRIAETELQIIQVDQELRTEVAKELREVEGRIGELTERRVAANDQLMRIDIRAPQAGLVHELTVHTVGGVIQAGEPIMNIVPYSDNLVIEAKIAPQDIDQIAPDQKAFVRFTAFNQQTTPELTGVVKKVSADTSVDTRDGFHYYTARIMLSQDEMKRLGQLKLRPGMPAEVHIKTSERSALSYFIKPLMDQVDRTFRER